MSIKHIGIIMDGNRRWAKGCGLMPHQGHNKGGEVFGNVCDWCIEGGVRYLTAYAFSTENWKRSANEVNHIFKLLEKFFKDEKETCVRKDIRLRVIGERSRFDKKTLSIIEDIEGYTAHCNTLDVQIALSYGGRNEIVRAVQRLSQDVKDMRILCNDINEDILESYLDTAGIPDVDLIIRTGGAENRRLSNFLTWQSVYAELYFSDLLWPDFSHDEFMSAIDYYNSVKRKLGT